MASLGAELKADLKAQHWTYGYEDHGAHMRTTYRDDMVEKKGKQAAMSKEAKDDLRCCHYELGSASGAESVGGTTTNAAHFQGRPGGSSALSKEAQADLRCSHFVRRPPPCPHSRRPAPPPRPPLCHPPNRSQKRFVLRRSRATSRTWPRS